MRPRWGWIGCLWLVAATSCGWTRGSRAPDDDSPPGPRGAALPSRPARQPPGRGPTDDAPGPRLAPVPSPAPPVTAVDPCARASDCAACTAIQGCRFCTEPRGCTQAGAPCPGLSLGHASTCGNDPFERKRAEQAAIEATRQAIRATTTGMTLDGASIDGHLERFSAVELPLAAGRCYTILWTLAPGAVPGNVKIRLGFKDARLDEGGVTAFALDARMGTSGVHCTKLPAVFRFALIDWYTLAPVSAAGTGQLSLVLYGRPMTASDRVSDPVGDTLRQGGSVGVDCQDCTFPCESSRRDCERRCFVDERDSTERGRCERTCEQIGRSCLRGCPGCW